MSALDFFEPIVAIINKVIPDKAQAAVAADQLKATLVSGELAQEMAQLTAVTTAQSDVDKVEAGSASVFVAGARPFTMWVGALGMAYVSIVEPIARFVAKVGFGYAGAFPAIDTTMTMQVLLGLLGLGAMRSYDKLKGTDTKAIGT